MQDKTLGGNWENITALKQIALLVSESESLFSMIMYPIMNLTNFWFFVIYSLVALTVRQRKGLDVIFTL